MKRNEKKLMQDDIVIERVWSMPNKHTFEILPIKQLLSEEVDLTLLWIDPFANTNKIATITNDLSTEYDTDYHMDALDFLKTFEDESVDGVLYDPPYSPRQVSECYNNVGYSVTWDTTKASFWGNHKKEISRIVKKGGKVITFGWNSGGIGKKYGFDITRILLVPHGGWHNDTICTVEIKNHDSLANERKEIIDKEETMNNKIDEQLIAELRSLPIDYWDFRDSDTKEYTHGIHTYPAVMVSPISRNILRIMEKYIRIDSLFDPFMGSGTVLVEGILAGVKNISGNDINPLALYISEAKTKVLDTELLVSEVEALYDQIETDIREYNDHIERINERITERFELDLAAKKGWGEEAPYYLKRYYEDEGISLEVPDFKNIGYWCKPKVVMLLSLIRKEISQIKNKDIRRYIYIAFSETIRLVSNRRNGEFKMYRMEADKVRAFDPDVFMEFRNILDRNIAKMCSFKEHLAENSLTPNVTIYSNNACNLDDIPDDYFGLVITSPPYGDSRTTVAYGEYSRLSLQWIDDFDMNDKGNQF